MTSTNQNKILLLHTSTVNPLSFAFRLTGNEVQENEDVVKWKIDNKYYTADVDIHISELSKTIDETTIRDWKEIDVIVYVFEKVPISLPPTLIKVLSTPRDIAIAVRTLPSPSSNKDSSHDHSEHGTYAELVDMLEEVGMEFIDEVNPLTEEDDERPMEPLEIIRQNLMTHLWPNMNRKPLNISSSPQIPSAISSPTSSPKQATFPETFASIEASASFSPFANADVDVLGGPSEIGATSAFPGLEELRAQIYANQFDNIDRLDNLGDGFGNGPSEEEYTRLDDWLDSDEDDDEEQEQIQYGQLEDDDDHAGNNENALNRKDADIQVDDASLDDWENRSGASKARNDKRDWLDTDDMRFDPIEFDLPSGSISPKVQEQEGFEDDFDEYTEFQSAPSMSAGLNDPTLALDPTPLLLHLQSVRDELANVQDENERRVRAGKEVQQILASLGMGDLAEDDLDLHGII
ncbi:uncharacterized protein IL334_002071 [Kwoniella shivajii]|uniref:Uncharacterized protein n=1 Tax=Kwoniella shivajii TaxID=564305 RepID=A0ABZ1CUX7_9TREE|nr:hypothetical protein IL334_002071 [Kwoniella shivajii]